MPLPGGPSSLLRFGIGGGMGQTQVIALYTLSNVRVESALDTLWLASTRPRLGLGDRGHGRVESSASATDSRAGSAAPRTAACHHLPAARQPQRQGSYRGRQLMPTISTGKHPGEFAPGVVRDAKVLSRTFSTSSEGKP